MVWRAQGKETAPAKGLSEPGSGSVGDAVDAVLGPSVAEQIADRGRLEQGRSGRRQGIVEGADGTPVHANRAVQFEELQRAGVVVPPCALVAREPPGTALGPA